MISIGGLKHAELVAPPDELQPAESVGAHGTQSDGLPHHYQPLPG